MLDGSCTKSELNKVQYFRLWVGCYLISKPFSVALVTTPETENLHLHLHTLYQIQIKVICQNFVVKTSLLIWFDKSF